MNGQEDSSIKNKNKIKIKGSAKNVQNQSTTAPVDNTGSNAKWAQNDEAWNGNTPIKLSINGLMERYLLTTNSNEF